MLSDEKIGRIKAAYEILKNKSTVAKMEKVCYATVSKVLGGYKRKQRKPCPRVTKRIRIVKKLASMKESRGGRTYPRYGSAAEIRGALRKATGEIVSVRQVLRYLSAGGLRPYVRPTSTTRRACDLAKKKAFAKRMRTISPAKLRSIVFSDESWLSCVERTSKLQWCAKKEDALPREKKARWNVPSALVWAACGVGYKGPLIVFPSRLRDDVGDSKVFRLDARRYIDKCLVKVVPFLLQKKRLWQQDGARAHASKTVYAYLKRKGVERIEDWPPYSAEWNAIERVWNELANRVGRRCPMTQEELVVIAQEEWSKIPQALIDKHCNHFITQMKEYK